MRILIALLLCPLLAQAAGTTSVIPSGTLLGNSSGSTAAPSALNSPQTAALAATALGPCDVIAKGGQTCVAAHSLTRRMFASYTGRIFQLTRASDSTTSDISTVSTGLYDSAAVATFCAGTSCYISNIYDQTGNANHLPQATVANMAPWFLYGANGYPSVVTAANAAFYRNRPASGGATTNIPTGTASATTYAVEGMSIFSACCGNYGRAENNISGPYLSGASWELGYNNWTGNTLSGGIGLGIDMEAPNFPTTALATVPAVAGYLSKYNGATNIYFDKFWDVSTGILAALVQQPPPQTEVVQAGISLGEGGDGSSAPAEFFEGAIASGYTSAATDALLAANVSAFYATPSKTYLGPVDLAYNNGNCGGTLCASNVKRNLVAAVGGAWGLRRLRASYTGYAATIRRASDSTTLNVGFTATGDFDDNAAQAFCSGTTCTVATLYNQSIGYQSNDGKGTTFDMVQVTTALQPQLIFNDFNNRTAMRSTGTQYMCTNGAAGLTAVGPSWTANVVAKRTGGTGGIGIALGGNGPDIRFPASVNTMALHTSNSGIDVSLTAADSAWHVAIGQNNLTTAANGDLSFQVDNSLPAVTGGNGNFLYFSSSSSFESLFSGSFGANCTSAFRVMTGDIAEAVVYGISKPVSTSAGYDGSLSPAQIQAIYQNQTTYYGLSTPAINTTPTISSGFGTSPSITANKGPASFSVNVGTGGAASTGVIALPLAAHGWACSSADVTTPATNLTQQTGSSTTTATFTNYVRTTGVAGAWTASDVLQIGCSPN